jgi:hypothetical protein
MCGPQNLCIQYQMDYRLLLLRLRVIDEVCLLQAEYTAVYKKCYLNIFDAEQF